MPKVSRIEPLWCHVKHEALPVRSDRTLDDLRAAVVDAFNQFAVPCPTTDSTPHLPVAA